MINFFRRVLAGFKNFWYFRKVIWRYRDFDYKYSVDILVKSLEKLADGIEKRSVIKVHKEIVYDIRRFCELLKKEEYESDWYDEVISNTDIKFKELSDGNTVLVVDCEDDKTHRNYERVVNKSLLWEKARISSLAKLGKKYTQWWD